eukprot:TCALIF_11528-PA protein Name:"Protein of unknown function" AED:0.10 eAED:0.10 QI:36/1/0/1/0/0/2/87/59
MVQLWDYRKISFGVHLNQITSKQRSMPSFGRAMVFASLMMSHQWKKTSFAQLQLVIHLQ